MEGDVKTPHRTTSSSSQTAVVVFTASTTTGQASSDRRSIKSRSKPASAASIFVLVGGLRHPLKPIRRRERGQRESTLFASTTRLEVHIQEIPMPCVEAIEDLDAQSPTAPKGGKDDQDS